MTKKLQTIPEININNLSPEQIEAINTLAQRLAKMELDMALIMRIALDFVDLFGLLNESKTAIKPEILSGQEDPLPAILNQIVQIATVDAVMAKVSKRKREELEARFAFLGYMGLIIGKYPAAPKTIYSDLKAANQQTI